MNLKCYRQNVTTMKQYPQTVDFGVFCRSSSGVDPVVSSHTGPCGHFIDCTKKKEK